MIAEIISQHAEEAAFLWLLRDMAVREPHYSLQDLAALDERVEANLDGLRIAGDAGWEICAEELSWQEPGEVFAAAVLAFESGNMERVKEVLRVGGQSRELARGVVSALGWMPYKNARKYIAGFLKNEHPLLRQMGIAAGAIHRQDPGDALIAALRDEHEDLRARALRAVGELGKAELMPYLKGNFVHESPRCRFWAAWSAAILGSSEAIEILKSLYPQLGGRLREEAAKTAIRKMKPVDAGAWLKALSGQPEHLRLAIVGAGASGDPVHIPWLMEMMEVNELARVAGEAFTMITGVDLAYHDLEGEWPEGFEAGPTENPEDEDVDLDPDEDLPWPEPESIRNWWKQHQSNFRSGTRYLLGQPISPEWLQQVLRNGMQRQRTAAAMEIAMANPGQPLFEVRAPGFRQKELLNAL